jgi:hypothetical protein
VCKPNCADFPTAANNKHKPIHSKLSVAMLSAIEYSITGNTTLKSNERVNAKMSPSPTNKKMSPIRLTITAFIAALLASARVNQKLISMKLIIPTPSHPTKRTKNELAETSTNMKNANNDK